MGEPRWGFLGLDLAHPIVNGSGTYDAIAARRAFGDALLERFPFSAFVSKTITLEPRAGNPPPRLYETPSGLINSIGLPNKGLRGYLEHDLPELARLPVPLITNVMGSSADEIGALLEALDERGDLLDRAAHDVRDQRDGEPRQLGQVVGQVALEALVGQPDRVEHPGRGLEQPRRRVAGPRAQRDRLGDEGGEREALEQRVAEHPAGGDRVVGARAVDDPVLELQAAEVDRRARRQRAGVPAAGRRGRRIRVWRGQWPTPGASALSIAAASTTGPSRHTRR